MTGGIEADILAEAHRQLDQQVSELGDLRTRAAGVLGAGGVIAGLFVGRFTADFNGWAWAALACLLLGALAAMYVISPRNLSLSQNLRTTLAWYDDFGQRAGAEASWQISSAQNLLRDSDFNQDVIRRMSVSLVVECALLALQLLMWVLSVATT